MTASMKAAWMLPTLALLGGCASLAPGEATVDAARWSERAGHGAPALATDEAVKQARRARSQQLLAAPLGEAQAIELALVHSPALQALLADSWQQQARTMQRGALPAPVFGFERLTHDGTVSITRMLSVGLAELITLPMRRDAAARSNDAERLKLAAEVLAQSGKLRQQWVRAVAAAHLVGYHRQVKDTAAAGAELARRMQAVGNFSRTQRAREQVFLNEAAAMLARAELAATTEREALIRALGLSAEQGARLQLPTQLADLPPAPRSPDEIGRAAMHERLDLLLAERQWVAARAAQNPALAEAFDAELAGIRESATGGERARGFELAFKLPLDVGARRQAASAATLAALNRLEQARIDASSTLREQYAVYRTAWDLAQHQRDQVLPLRKLITDEAVLRYNGMLIGVFELLAEARAQAAAVVATIEAQRDFWLADAALNAALLGAPAITMNLSASMPAAAESGGGH